MLPKHGKHSIRKGKGVRRIFISPNSWRHRNSCLNTHDCRTHIGIYNPLTSFHVISCIELIYTRKYTQIISLTFSFKTLFTGFSLKKTRLRCPIAAKSEAMGRSFLAVLVLVLVVVARMLSLAALPACNVAQGTT